MKFVTIVVAMMFALGTAGVSMSAQGRGNGQARKTATKPAKTETRTVKAETRTAKTTAKADARAAKTTAKADARAAKTTAKAETRAARTDTGATTTKTDTKAARLNPDQETRLLSRLPAGMTVQDAAAGFRNWGQFNAAVNASNNHNISFVDLKAAMTGIPVGGTEPTMAPMSLGQAMKSLGVTTTTTTMTTTPTP
jgi:hypothetical protein